MRYTRLSNTPDGINQDIPTGKTEKSKIITAFQIAATLVIFALGLVLGVVFVNTVDRTGAKSPASHCGDEGSISINTPADDDVPEVCFPSRLKQSVRHYPEFESAPPEAGSEPVWDALIPDGLGYIIHPDLSPNISVIAVFHQLHCLYLIRRAYYIPTPENQTKDFDTGIARHPHVGHCFDYLRLTLLCAADSTLEPTTEKVNGNPKWGFEKQCRDYESVKNWAEKRKAFDIRGSFVPFHFDDQDSHTTFFEDEDIA
ncbi:hypothetical protein BDV12DRAFT_208890 [Aspergillus spectabilis]